MPVSRLAAAALALAALSVQAAANDSANFVGFARKAMADGHFDAAVNLADTALQKDPNNAEAWLVRAEADNAQDRFQQAEGDAGRALALNSSLTPALNARAYARCG